MPTTAGNLERLEAVESLYFGRLARRTDGFFVAELAKSTRLSNAGDSNGTLTAMVNRGDAMDIDSHGRLPVWRRA